MITGLRNVVGTAVQTLNQPPIKEGIKNVAGVATFVFGLMEIYDCYQIYQGRSIETENYDAPSWTHTAHKVTIICAKLSLILSAGVSRPGVFIISSVIGSVFSTRQLVRVFGPNTIYALNPHHPRHLASFAAVILALPAVTQSVYRTIKGSRPKSNYPDDGLTDSKIRRMVFFNTVTSRPVLHWGNQLGHKLINIFK